MRIKDYGRSPRKRKQYVQQPDLMLVGVDVSKAKHDACFAQTNHTISFKNNREGFQHVEKVLRKNISKTKSRKVSIAMEPSGLYWYSLYDRLKRCGFSLCVMINGRKRFLEKWKPRKKCGQWSPAKLNMIYDLAKKSVGLRDPHRSDAFEIKTLAADLADTLNKQQLWLDKAIELLENRADFKLLLTLPRIGKPTAVAILTAIGDINEYTNGKQLVKLAGLDIRYFESGSSIKKGPRISHVGSAYLRHWVFHFSLRLIAHLPEFKLIFQKYKEKSQGKGAGLRGMMVVCDKVLRIIYAMLSKNKVYLDSPEKISTYCFYRVKLGEKW